MSKKKGPQALSTLAIHGGAEARHPGDPVVAPLVQSVNYVQEVGTGAGLRYTRYGNTPNAERIQKRIALLEGAEASLVLSSGMGATACAMLALLRPGDHLLASSLIYGGTHRLLMEEFNRHGIDVTLVDPIEPRGWRKRLRKETRAIFVESPVNPTCRVLDLRPISHLAKEVGLALVVDSTFASPVNFRPIEHGADVVIHSATKYFNGHHDVLAGVVAGTESYIQEVLQKEMVWGQTPDPFALWLLERGVKTIDVRVRRQNENAMRVAEWCAGPQRDQARALPGAPCPSRPRDRARDARRLRRDAGDRTRRRRPRVGEVPAPPQAHHARREPRRRGFARQRATLHVARRRCRARSARTSAFRTGSCA